MDLLQTVVADDLTQPAALAGEQQIAAPRADLQDAEGLHRLSLIGEHGIGA